MKKAIDISEIVEAIDSPDGPAEVCATAEAEYDDSRGRVIVRAKSFVRTTDLRIAEKRWVPDWLPKDQLMEDGVSPEEAVTAAKEIFRRWVEKVRRTVPRQIADQPGGKNYAAKIHC